LGADEPDEFGQHCAVEQILQVVALEGTAEEAEGNGGRLVSGEPPSVPGQSPTEEATERFPPSPDLEL